MGIIVVYWEISWEQMILWMLSISMTYDAELNIQDFKHFIKCRDKSGKRAFGGLSVYVNQKVAEGVSYVPTENKNAIWCKLDRTYCNFQKDIYLGTVYLSPSNFERSDSVDLIGGIRS